ncbi:MAG: endonuclease NucS [Nitrososphaeria archaeon]
MVNIVFDPSLNEAMSFFIESLAERKFVVCFGLFSVEYLGRSSSNLGFGERLLIVKEDGSVIVHRRTGYEPVNWQPKGCRIKCSVIGDRMILLSERKKPREFLKMVFQKVYLILSASPIDDARFTMGPSEETFYDVLFSNPDLIEKGLKLVSRQKVLQSGVPDFTGVDSAGYYVFVEVKRHTAGVDAVRQLDRYVRSQPRQLRGILCAPSLTKSAKALLEKKGFTFRRLDLRLLSSLIVMQPYEETLDRHLGDSSKP